MIRIFLIRHAESIQNAKQNYNNLPEHLIYLTENGKVQAEKCGKFLKDYCNKMNLNMNKATLFVSPYTRTRETASILNKHLGITNVKEDICLIEHQYGLFENVEDDDWKDYDKQYKHYEKYYNNNGKFYAKFPQGESPFDVALRTRQFLFTMFKDVDDGIENFFIVSHGTTIRAFLLSYFHYSPEWFNAESNMENCAVRLIERQSHNNSIDKDYIYGNRINTSKTTAKNT